VKAKKKRRQSFPHIRWTGEKRRLGIKTEKSTFFQPVNETQLKKKVPLPDLRKGGHPQSKSKHPEIDIIKPGRKTKRV